MNVFTAIPKCIEALMLDGGVQRATAYIGEKLTVKATRQYRPRRRSSSETYIVTFGRPNYAERAFIKKCKAVGEPLPVKKIQLKLYPIRQKEAA